MSKMTFGPGLYFVEVGPQSKHVCISFAEGAVGELPIVHCVPEAFADTLLEVLKVYGIGLSIASTKEGVMDVINESTDKFELGPGMYFFTIGPESKHAHISFVGGQLQGRPLIHCVPEMFASILTDILRVYGADLGVVSR